jgi:hypothetical protein
MWSAEMQALPGTSNLIKQLKHEGGSAITHVGRLTRVDGRSFTILAAEGALYDLHQFLSFARGLHTAIFGVAGVSANGNIVYEDWGMRLSTNWESRLGWFDVHHGQTLGQVYPGFASLLRDRDFGKAVAQALYWYLRSNRAGEGAGVDGGLLLSQAALERLTHAYLRKTGLGTDGHTADRIRRALLHLNLPVSISRHTRRLLAGRRRGAWKDAPDAITKVRNELVHPKNRLKVPLAPVISECWQLAQWYVEILILRLAGFRGTYSNRLNPKWIGQVETVPWVKKKPKA